jgi:hypothetical protein
MRHVSATLLAAPALSGADGCHFISVRELFAHFGAFFADLGAQRAIGSVKRRHSEHEVGAGETRLRTVMQKPLMMWQGMLIAEVKPARGGLEACRVARHAVIDASFQLIGKLPFRHEPPLSGGLLFSSAGGLPCCLAEALRAFGANRFACGLPSGGRSAAPRTGPSLTRQSRRRSCLAAFAL